MEPPGITTINTDFMAFIPSFFPASYIVWPALVCHFDLLNQIIYLYHWILKEFQMYIGNFTTYNSELFIWQSWFSTYDSNMMLFYDLVWNRLHVCNLHMIFICESYVLNQVACGLGISLLKIKRVLSFGSIYYK